MLKDLETVINEIQKGKKLLLSGDEEILKKLPQGSWIGGTIPYFMDETGGVVEREKIFITELPDYISIKEIKYYNSSNLKNIPEEAANNGFSFIIIPATSESHIKYAEEAPNYKNIFLKPIIGWISGVHLDELGQKKPKVFNGLSGESSDEKAVVMHISLPESKIAQIGIVNLFDQGDGVSIKFEKDGFHVENAIINGENQNLANYINNNKIDTKLPLVADYCGAMINVSFQKINDDNTVDFYAPVFKDIQYKIAKPVDDYISEFKSALPKGVTTPIFSCNCILNFLYSELEGQNTDPVFGPITFGEIAYQLLNQTLVYLEVKDV